MVERAQYNTRLQPGDMGSRNSTQVYPSDMISSNITRLKSGVMCSRNSTQVYPSDMISSNITRLKPGVMLELCDTQVPGDGSQSTW
jgi:hypothetical protein